MMNVNNIIEYAGTPENIFYINNDAAGASMAETETQKSSKKRNGMRIIFEFPAKSMENEKLIKMEVNSVMQSALREQMHKHLLS